MIAIPSNPDFVKYSERCYGNELPCVVCGRPVKKPRTMLHCFEGIDWALDAEEAKTVDPASDMGLYPIGRDCLKKNPQLLPYVIILGEKSEPV